MIKKTTTKSFLLSILLCSILSSCSTFTGLNRTGLQGYPLPSVISWKSSQGIKRLEQSKHKVDFFALSNHFEGQLNKIFCGPASMAIVLNALRVRDGISELPTDPLLLSDIDRAHLPKGNFSPYYKRYNQNNVFIDKVKKRAVVLGEKIDGKTDYGFQLRQLGNLFSAHQTLCDIRVVNDKSASQVIKEELIENLKTPNDYVVINYKRTILNQVGGGHISPLAAYHKKSDSFLIMDVTPNKADWVWVKSDLLIQAMRTFDTLENRGYLLIQNQATTNLIAP